MVPFADRDCRAREVECRSVLNKSGLADYAVNCYAGCEHGCVYCYARFATRFSHPGEPWGSFVDVKVNAARVLAHEANRERLGRVFISSVCDGWQPLEASYYLTRQCLEILVSHRYPLTTLNESLRQLIERRSSPSSERLALLQEAKRRGMRTYAFLGPLLPHLSDTEESLTSLLKAVKDVGADYFYVDRLNRRFGVWLSLKSLLWEHSPNLVDEYRRIFFNESASREYSDRLVATVNCLARKQGLDGRMRLCF